jgi:hypothetical protein
MRVPMGAACGTGISIQHGCMGVPWLLWNRALNIAACGSHWVPWVLWMWAFSQSNIDNISFDANLGGSSGCMQVPSGENIGQVPKHHESLGLLIEHRLIEMGAAAVGGPICPSAVHGSQWVPCLGQASQFTIVALGSQWMPHCW